MSKEKNKFDLKNIQIGQEVSYKSSVSTYTGTVVKKNEDNLIVIDCQSGMKLWNAGGNVGSIVYVDQIVK